MTGLKPLQTKIHRIEDYLVKIRDLGLAPSVQIVAVLLQTEQLLRRWIEKLKADADHVEDSKAVEEALAAIVNAGGGKASDPGAEFEPPPQEKKKPTSGSSDSLRVSVDKLDRLIQLVGELSLQQSIVDRPLRTGRSIPRK